MRFSTLSLSPKLTQAADTIGLTSPTPIQAQSIPCIVEGKDLLACAPTGSGKTAAYVLPLLNAWLANSARTPYKTIPTHALILVPTRELAAQVASLITALGKAMVHRPKIIALTGGVSINPQLMELRGGVDFVIATPGRLLDVVAHSRLDLTTIQTLVLDEADRLMDLGFAEELDRVLALLPVLGQRQTLLFSATFGAAVEKIIPRLLRDNHSRIRVENTHHEDATILQRALYVNEKDRTSVLRELIEQYPDQRILVFVASRYSSEHVANKLYAKKIYATALHGDMSQGARQRVLQEFKDQQWQVLITTDLASRGIHIDALPLVVNYDLPRSPDDYTHRVGRTGRAGLTGTAISLISPASRAHWELIAKRNRLQLKLETLKNYPVTDALPPPVTPALDTNGGIKGKRPSKKDKLRAAAAAAANKE